MSIRSKFALWTVIATVFLMPLSCADDGSEVLRGVQDQDMLEAVSDEVFAQRFDPGDRFRGFISDLLFAPPPTDHNGIFASPFGSDDNPGTRQAPVRSLNRAAALAEDADKAVFAAAGEYRESLNLRVSLFGGYHPVTWERDLVNQPTILRTVAPSLLTLQASSNPNQPNRILEGLTIIGGSSSDNYAAGVQAWHGHWLLSQNRITTVDQYDWSPIAQVASLGVSVGQIDRIAIVNNDIATGTVGAGMTAIVEAVSIGSGGSNVVLWNNRLTPGVTVSPISAGSTGVGGSCGGGTVRLYGNWFAGEAMLSAGLRWQFGLGTYQCRIEAAANVFDLQQGNVVKGLEIYDSRANLTNNTVVVRGLKESYAVWLGNSDQTVLVNNVLQVSPGLDAAAAVVLGDSEELRFYHNDFVPGLGVALLQVVDVPVFDIEEINDCRWAWCADAAGNLSVTPEFDPGRPYHLAAGSPLIDAGADPHQWSDLVYPLDVDEELRPLGAAWDIGADEYFLFE